MIDPDSTKVLPRRILASLIDLGTVFLPALLVLKATVITYKNIERNPDGSWQPTAGQYQETQNLSFRDSLVRVQEWGDSIYIFGGLKYWIGLLFILLLAVLVFILVPAKTGASLGKRLTGLRAVDKDGEPPTVSQYITRTVVGIVDFPIFGALGWIVASNDAQTRRIGDRVAGTLVVDAREDLQFVDEAAWQRQREALDNPLLTQAPADLDSMVALDDRLGGRARFDSPDLAVPAGNMPDIEMPDLAAANLEMPDLATENLETPDLGAANLETPDLAAANLEMPDLAAANLETPDLAAANLEMPDLGMPDVANLEMPDLGMPDVANLEMPDLGMPDVAAPLANRSVRDASPGEWDQPVGTDAPVWDPHAAPADPYTIPPVDLLAQQAEAQARQAEVAAAEQAAYEVAAQRAAAQQAAAQQAAAEQAEPQPAATQTAALDPVWSAEWNSWLYWDASGERWLRHDEQANAWVPIS